MAGFTINGFGASDSYRTLKELKTARCASCKRDTMFALMELKMRIRLLYIPTVPIGTKYAVVCTRCKNGYYVNEEQRNFILDNPASVVTIASDGVVLHGIHAQKDAIEAPVVPEPPVQTPEPADVSQPKPVQQPPVVQPKPVPQTPVVQTAAPVQQPPVKQAPTYATLAQSELDAIFVQDTSDPGETFHTFFGNETSAGAAANPKQTAIHAAPVKQEAAPQVSYSRRKICPSCRMMFAPDKQFCNICGSLLEMK